MKGQFQHFQIIKYHHYIFIPTGSTPLVLLFPLPIFSMKFSNFILRN